MDDDGGERVGGRDGVERKLYMHETTNSRARTASVTLQRRILSALSSQRNTRRFREEVQTNTHMRR